MPWEVAAGRCRLQMLWSTPGSQGGVKDRRGPRSGEGWLGQGRAPMHPDPTPQPHSMPDSHGSQLFWPPPPTAFRTPSAEPPLFPMQPMARPHGLCCPQPHPSPCTMLRPRSGSAWTVPCYIRWLVSILELHWSDVGFCLLTVAGMCWVCPLGAFSHSAGAARAQRQLLCCLSREHPCKPPMYRSIHDQFKTASGCRIQDPGTRGKHHTDKTIPGVPAGASGCRCQDPGTHGYR